MRGRWMRLTTAAVVAMALVACGDDDLEPTTVAITGVDYAFEGVPERVAAGSTLTLTNASSVEVHELVAIHLPDDVDLSIEELLELPDEEVDALIPEGPPAMVLIAGPNEDAIAVVGDGTLSEPGRYALLCFIPSGADPAEFFAAAEGGGDGPPEVDGGPPHVVHGMYAELVVE